MEMFLLILLIVIGGCAIFYGCWQEHLQHEEMMRKIYEDIDEANRRRSLTEIQLPERKSSTQYTYELHTASFASSMDAGSSFSSDCSTSDSGSSGDCSCDCSGGCD